VRQFLFFPEKKKKARVKIFENESVRAREIFCLGLTVADEEEEEGRTISSHQFSL